MIETPQRTIPDVPILDAETIDFAYQRIIEFSVIGAAFVVVFIAFMALVWWVLRGSKAEIRSARDSERSAHAASIQMAEKTVGINIQLVERIDRLIEMSNSIIRRLSALGGGGPDAPTGAA